MALGFGSTADKPTDSDSNDAKKPDDFQDAEKQASIDAERRGSRVGGVNRRDMTSDDEASISVGKQIELEAGNAIQYRTCSWPKVCFLTLRLWRGLL